MFQVLCDSNPYWQSYSVFPMSSPVCFVCSNETANDLLGDLVGGLEKYPARIRQHMFSPLTFFPTLLCGVLVFLAAPPRSSSVLAPPPSSFNLSLTQHLSQQHLAAPPRSSSSLLPPSSSLTQHRSQQHLSLHHNVTQTTSRTQHTTSLTQHRMPRGRMTKHHSENIPHTDNIPHTTHNITHTTSDAQRLTHHSTHTQHHSQAQHVSWQVQHSAACHGVGCTPWRRLGTGA